MDPGVSSSSQISPFLTLVRAVIFGSPVLSDRNDSLLFYRLWAIRCVDTVSHTSSSVNGDVRLNILAISSDAAEMEPSLGAKETLKPSSRFRRHVKRGYANSGCFGRLVLHVDA